jgi:protein O-mannosyl-transferase
LGGAFIAAITVIAYLPAWNGGFIWDDDQHLTQNPCIVGPLGLKDIWTSRAARICPLVQTTFWVEHALWGLNPFLYHIVNVLVHAACAVVLWRVLLNLHIRGAWLGAALWALHPVQVETAAWITELKNTQSCLFYLLAILFFVKSETAQELKDSSGTRWSYALSLLCAALAMTSKSSTVILPFVLGLSPWWIDGRWEWRKLTKLTPFFLMSVAASLLSIWTQNLEGANQSEYVRGWLERIAVAGKVVWFYLGKLAWPHPLIFIYPRWEIDVSRATSYLPTAAVGVVLFVCWWNRRGRLRPVFLAFAYFLAALLPVLGLIDHYFLRYSFVGDHFQYLASIGPLAVAGAGITTALGLLEKARRFLEPVFCGALLLLLGFLTWHQCAMYANSETLWRMTIERNPGCEACYNNLGDSLLRRGQVDEAIADYQKASEMSPRDSRPQSNLGFAFLQKGQVNEAIIHSQKALEIEPDGSEAHHILGDAYLAKGDFVQAIASYQEALRVKPNDATAHDNLGISFAAIGKISEAIEQFGEALRVDSNCAEAHYNLGYLLVELGHQKEAVGHLAEAVRLKPDYTQAKEQLRKLGVP